MSLAGLPQVAERRRADIQAGNDPAADVLSDLVAHHLTSGFARHHRPISVGCVRSTWWCLPSASGDSRRSEIRG